MAILLQSFLPSIVMLGTVLCLAIALAYGRAQVSDSELPAIARLVLLAVGCHLLHVGEEAWFGFPSLFPALFGLPAMPMSAFLAFNLAWVLIWIAGTRAHHSHRSVLALFWFLGLASSLNALAHPLLSLRVAGYFPGLITSPLVGVIGIMLTRRLYATSAAR